MIELPQLGVGIIMGGTAPPSVHLKMKQDPFHDYYLQEIHQRHFFNAMTCWGRENRCILEWEVKERRASWS
jgi:hypothetical protein